MESRLKCLWVRLLWYPRHPRSSIQPSLPCFLVLPHFILIPMLLPTVQTSSGLCFLKAVSQRGQTSLPPSSSSVTLSS